MDAYCKLILHHCRVTFKSGKACAIKSGKGQKAGQRSRMMGLASGRRVVGVGKRVMNCSFSWPPRMREEDGFFALKLTPAGRPARRHQSNTKPLIFQASTCFSGG